jgi:hypothetical protein
MIPVVMPGYYTQPPAGDLAASYSIHLCSFLDLMESNSLFSLPSPGWVPMDFRTEMLLSKAETEPRYLDNLVARNKDGSDFIRLLRILTPSSRPSEATLCELKIFSLDFAPRYSALSYCRQPTSRLIAVDFRGSLSGSFPISHDLRSAIRAIHQRRQTVWFWIDALCINQSSTEEKNDQVPRMREIYEKSYAGLIWLGNAVARNQTDWELLSVSTPGLKKEFHDHNEILGLTRGKVRQLSVLDFAHRAWWNRTWVVQKMILPARLHVCVGLQVISWGQFVNASDTWSQMFVPHSTPGIASHSACRMILLSLQSMRSTSHTDGKHSLDILQLLELSRHAIASDTRDNVYGIMGLISPQDRREIRVDYSRTTNHVYAEMTAMLIKKYQSLDLIVNSFWHKNERSQAWLPSLVIDYGAGLHGAWDHVDPRTDGLPALCSRPQITRYGFKAGAETPVSTSVKDDPLKLRLDAVVLDTVNEVLAGHVSERIPTRGELNRHRQAESNGGYYHLPIGRSLPFWLKSAVGII